MGKALQVRFVFKASIVLLAVSAVVGQSWMHAPADAGALTGMARISEECPSLAVEARRGRTSKVDALWQRDSYWRARIVGLVTGDDGCAVGKVREGA